MICSTYSCTHRLILICASTLQTCDLAVWGRCPSQLSCLGRASDPCPSTVFLLFAPLRPASWGYATSFPAGHRPRTTVQLLERQGVSFPCDSFSPMGSLEGLMLRDMRLWNHRSCGNAAAAMAPKEERVHCCHSWACSARDPRSSQVPLPRTAPSWSAACQAREARFGVSQVFPISPAAPDCPGELPLCS